MLAAPSNLLQNTFFFKYADNAGTCFRILFKGKHFLITAKHICPTIKNGDNILIKRIDDWIPIKVKVIECQNPDADILAFETHIELRNDLNGIEIPDSNFFHVGQEIFLAGFPEGFIKQGISEWIEVNQGYPLPFIKKSIISQLGHKNGVDFIFIDAVANKGFSGGPIFYEVLDGKKNDSVAGIISAHLYDTKFIINSEGIELGSKNSFYSNISYAHRIAHITEAIQKYILDSQ